MHLIIMANTFEEDLQMFEKWCCSRQFKDKKGKKWKISPRRIQFYDLIMPKEIQAKVVSTLRQFENKDVEGKLKWPKRIMKLGGVKMADTSIEPKKQKTKLDKKLGWWTHINIIGAIEDPLYESGVEYL